jgi:hypothetical protein
MLRGNLSDFPLVGVLQLVARDRRSGSLRILGEHAGSIGVRHGAIVDAAFYPSSGERALSLLGSLPSAAFEFDSKTEPVAQSIARPTHELLIDLHMQHARWLEVRRTLGDWSTPPHWLERPEKFSSAEHALVGSFVNATRSLGAILHECPLPPLRCAEVLLELRAVHLIALDGVNGRLKPQRLTVIAVRYPDERTVFIDRDLHASWAGMFGRFQVSLEAGKGTALVFNAQARDRIPGRIMVPHGVLRRLRLAAGATVVVTPRPATRSASTLELP